MIDEGNMINIQKLIVSLTKGERPARPVYCNDEIFNIMKKCWRFNKDKRTKFAFLKHHIHQALKNVNVNNLPNNSM